MGLFGLMLVVLGGGGTFPHPLVCDGIIDSGTWATSKTSHGTSRVCAGGTTSRGSTAGEFPAAV